VKKGLIMILMIGAVVASGFMLPKWLLGHQMQKSHEWELKSDLSLQVSLDEDIDLFKRLQLLNDPNAQAVALDITDDQITEAMQILQKEFEDLLEYGYQSSPIAVEEFEHHYDVEHLVYIDEQQILRVYRIVSESAFAIIDRESNKILCIGSAIAPWERAADVLNVTFGEELLSVKTIEAFAKYYDMTIEDIKISETYYDDGENWAVISGYLLNAEGERLGFGLNFNLNTEIIRWTSIDDSIMNAEVSEAEDADMMQD